MCVCVCVHVPVCVRHSGVEMQQTERVCVTERKRSWDCHHWFNPPPKERPCCSPEQSSLLWWWRGLRHASTISRFRLRPIRPKPQRTNTHSAYHTRLSVNWKNKKSRITCWGEFFWNLVVTGTLKFINSAQNEMMLEVPWHAIIGQRSSSCCKAVAILEADDYKVSGAWTSGMWDCVIIQSIVAARLCNPV